MDNDCCFNRQNFGHPNCGLGVFSNIVKPIFVPLRDSSGNPTVYSVNLDNFTTDVIGGAFYAQDQADRLYSFPVLENFVWAQADSLTEETTSGAKFFLREGVVTVTGELFNKDATPTMKGKVSAMRCNEWGVFFVTNSNQLIGAESTILNGVTGFNEDVLVPIPISSQSVDGIFSPTQDTTSQKIMFSFDLDRNFDTATLYMVDGNKMNNGDGEPEAFDFLHTPSVIDCNLDTLLTNLSLTTVTFTVEDDYRQGFRASGANGNVTGLIISDFTFTLQTGAIVVPDNITETSPGVYDVTYPLLSLGSADVVTITLVLGNTDPAYSGSVSYIVP